LCILIHSLFCMWNFSFLAFRPNFVEVACFTWKVEQADLDRSYEAWKFFSLINERHNKRKSTKKSWSLYLYSRISTATRLPWGWRRKYRSIYRAEGCNRRGMDSIISQSFIHSPEQPFGSENLSLPSHSKRQSFFPRAGGRSGSETDISLSIAVSSASCHSPRYSYSFLRHSLYSQDNVSAHHKKKWEK
jgi:hypothetical protein